MTITDNSIAQDRELSGDSVKWANWQAELLLNVCEYCAKQHGKIFDISILGNKTSANAHPHCRCIYVPMRTKEAGTATDQGLFGTDMYLILFGKLPENYITQDEAKRLGWKPKNGNLKDVLPDMLIGGDMYENDNGKSPYLSGRIWYEADINYTGGYRNRQRILYSNDGLIFVTYDHYHTFYELTDEGEE